MLLSHDQLLAATPDHAAALCGLNPEEPIWIALRARFDIAIAEANDFVTHPDTDEAKRTHWAGRERGFRDLWQELDDLRSGLWEGHEKKERSGVSR